MRTHAHVLLFALVPFLAAAQPVIMNTNRPLPGDVMSYLATNDPFTLPIGPEQVWDFSALSFEPQYTQLWIEPASAPDAELFPTADLVATWPSSMSHVYWTGAPDSMVLLGHHLVNNDPFIPMDPLVHMIYPCTLGTEWTDLYQPDPSAVDTVHVVADSYGTLVLPGVVLNDVLGLHQQFGGPLDAEMSLVGQTMVFFQPGVRWLVAEAHMVSYWYLGELDTTYYYSSIRDFSTIGLEEMPMSEGLELWPVPASRMLNLRWDDPRCNAAAQIFDATGRMQLTTTLQPCGSDVSMDVSTLAPGHYVLRVNDGRRVLVRSFTVE